MTADDTIYMQRCLELAQKGAYYTAPNPMVGSVIVCNGKIIGEGYHRKAGEPHAEINAINNVKDKSLLKKSTLYVNLEPCSHFGKTPPCAVKIAELGIPRVVIGIRDFSKKVNGKGVAILKEAGVEVEEGVLQEEAFFLNRRFFTYHQQHRPYIILKWAETQDGFIDIDRSVKQPEIHWITNALSKSLVHKGRAVESAILIGKNTALFDNPQLTVRHWSQTNSPVRVLIDKNLEVPKNAKIFDDTSKTIVFNALVSKQETTVSYVKIDFSDTQKVITQLLQYLYDMQLQSVIVEGGRETLLHFIKNNLWDEYQVYRGALCFENGVKAPDLPQEPQHEEALHETVLTVGYNEINL